MSDIFTKLYLNIAKFQYPNQMQIEPEDLNLFEHSLKKMIMNPTLFLLATITFSRLRPKMLRNLKEFFYKNRPESVKKQLLEEMNEKFSQINQKNSILQTTKKAYVNEINKQSDKYHDRIINEYENSDNHLFNEGASALRLNTSRKLKARKGGKDSEHQEEILNVPRKEPMFREEYFGFGKGVRAKASRLLYFKQFLNLKVDRSSFNNKALDFLVNSKIVYLPFLIFTFLTLFDFGYTTFGLYLKYQPLIDSYFYHANVKI